MYGKATRLTLLSLSSVPMRVFHLTWLAFFLCFFAWFAVAPLMPVIRDELHLTKEQIANINIAAVLVTIFVRLAIGPLCDRYGARRTYAWLMALGAIPVMGIALAQSYEAFLFCRLCIGAIGASFVVTQYHTSIMFAPNVVGTANATSAGWGNAGGGAAQAIMPLVMVALIGLGVEASLGWRAALFVPGILLLVMSAAYWRYADDTPQGRITGASTAAGGGAGGWQSFLAAAADYRVWMLFVTYGACFGVELTIHNLAAVYYVDRFGLDLKTAGFFAGAFGLLALFGRALGGLASDRIAHRRGLDGRTTLLFTLILAQGLGLMGFASMQSATTAVLAMLVFGLFVHMACGATYALTPFINRRVFGGVAGIVGAGGNVGAVAAGFLMKGAASTQQGLMTLGVIVIASAVCAIAVRFSREHKASERQLYAEALVARE
jgi:NNP family nitrate/nitrite transporter-like MFS transporter